jgi:hypothetical protein
VEEPEEKLTVSLCASWLFSDAIMNPREYVAPGVRPVILVDPLAFPAKSLPLPRIRAHPNFK